MVTLRKANRLEKRSKRRKTIAAHSTEDPPTLRVAVRQDGVKFLAEDTSAPKSPYHVMCADLPKARLALLANDTPMPQRMAAIHLVRLVLSHDFIPDPERTQVQPEEPPVAHIVNGGFVPIILMGMTMDGLPVYQTECAWALTNILSTTINRECIPKVMLTQIEKQTPTGTVKLSPYQIMLPLLDPPNVSGLKTSTKLRDQVIWAIANVMGEGDLYRDSFIKLGVLPKIMAILNIPPGPAAADVFCRRCASQLFCNACRKWDRVPPIDQVMHLLPYIANLLKVTDPETREDAIWALCYLTDQDEAFEPVIDAGLVQFVAESYILADRSICTQLGCARFMGNISNGSTEQVMSIVRAGALPKLRRLLRLHKDMEIKQEVMWLVANMCADSQMCLQEVIKAEFFPVVLEQMATGDLGMVYEGMWIFSNAVGMANAQQAVALINPGGLVKYFQTGGPMPPSVVPAIYQAMSQKGTSVDIVTVCLSTLDAVLEHGKKNAASTGGRNVCCTFVERLGILPIVENLQNHKNTDIYKRALEILETYFDIEETEGEVVPESRRQQPQGGGVFQATKGGGAGGGFEVAGDFSM